MDDRQTLQQIHDALTERMIDAIAQGNDLLANKWKRERDALAKQSIARVMNEIQVDPGILTSMAIYAVQKFRRVLNAYMGDGKVDPCTRMMVVNARSSAGARLASRTARDTLTGVKVAGMVTRHGSKTTASTQVCSTRQALVGLGMAKIEKGDTGKDLVIDLAHPLVECIA